MDLKRRVWWLVLFAVILFTCGCAGHRRRSLLQSEKKMYGYANITPLTDEEIQNGLIVGFISPYGNEVKTKKDCRVCHQEPDKKRSLNTDLYEIIVRAGVMGLSDEQLLAKIPVNSNDKLEDCRTCHRKQYHRRT